MASSNSSSPSEPAPEWRLTHPTALQLKREDIIQRKTVSVISFLLIPECRQFFLCVFLRWSKGDFIAAIRSLAPLKGKKFLTAINKKSIWRSKISAAKPSVPLLISLSTYWRPHTSYILLPSSLHFITLHLITLHYYSFISLLPSLHCVSQH